jgi:glycosyltransferase involved in cell wall biosynthesis
MKNPKISVVMSCFNETELEITNSVNSILNQTMRDFEFIIVIDNPKNKKIISILKTYSKKSRKIKLIINKTNLGLASSLNIGISLSYGKYIARMDADDVSLKNRLETQYNYLENNPLTDITFSWVNYLDNSGNIIKIHSPKNSICKKLKSNFLKKHIFIHPTLFCKKSVLVKNNYDSQYLKAQDFELWLRLIDKYNIEIIEEILLNYTVSRGINTKSSAIKNLMQIKFGILALLKNFKKYMYLVNYYLLMIKFIILFVLFNIITIKNEFKK